MVMDENSTICLSGGADGSDLQWGMTAGQAGQTVIHFSFEGHRSFAPSQEIVVLDNAKLSEADPHLEAASLMLKRHYPPRSAHVRCLLQRNWFQVAWSGSCYAVSAIKDGMVQGGTVWATAMFLLRHECKPCPLYVFDQESGLWFHWSGEWSQISAPPIPSGIWAGIGTRKLNNTGKNAIRNLMRYGQSN
jgi:hypothetical protein